MLGLFGRAVCLAAVMVAGLAVMRCRFSRSCFAIQMQVSLQGSKQQCEQLLPNSDYSEYNPKNDSMVLSSSTSMLLSDIRLSDMLNALRSSKSSQVNSLSGKASCIVRHFRRFSVLEGSVLTIPFSY